MKVTLTGGVADGRTIEALPGTNTINMPAINADGLAYASVYAMTGEWAYDTEAIPLPDPLEGVMEYLNALEDRAANRWAAFTDDELDYILDGLNLALGAERPRLPFRDGLLRWQRVKATAADVQAELEHRKTRT